MKKIAAASLLIVGILSPWSSNQTYAAQDNSNWMAEVSQQNVRFGETPLREVILPGSHDSGTGQLAVPGSPLDPSPDNFDLSNPVISAAAQAAKSTLKRWSQTQNLIVKDQLKEGARYFDLRVGPNQWYNAWRGFQLQETNLRTMHGVYGESVDPILADIDSFLDAHPKEIVILDFQHFYDMTNNSYDHLHQKLQSTFGDRIVPKSYGANVPLQTLWNNDKRVIILYGQDHQNTRPVVDLHTRYAAEFDSWIWDRNTFLDDPWPNTTDKAVLKSKLNQAISDNEKSGNKLWKLQAVFTPDVGRIIAGTLNIGHSSLHDLAQAANSNVMTWLNEEWADRKFNIIMLDYMEETNLMDFVRVKNGGKI